MSRVPAAWLRLEGQAPWRTFPGARWSLSNRNQAAGPHLDRKGAGVAAEQIHIPVMLDSVVAALAPALRDAGATYVDCTLGLGGHAAAILEACPEAKLIGIDRDPHALARARELLHGFGDRVSLVEAVYDELAAVLARLGTPRVDAVLLDLGLSSLQIDDLDRGFSYSKDSPLDMRMSPGQELTAATVVNTYPADAIARILRIYGEERFADRIASRIVAARQDAPFTTSARLVEVIAAAIPMATRKTGGHPAKRSFQALRIEVNGELGALERVLPQALDAVALGGRVAVLAYHSLEDRPVKAAFRVATSDRAPSGLPVVPPHLQPEFRAMTRGAQVPTAAEIAANPRAASARFRVVERIREAA